MTAAGGEAVVTRLLSMTDALRRAGVNVSMGEMLDATAALAALPLGDRPVIRAGLRASLIKRAEDAEIFETLFDQWFPRTGAAAGGARAAGGRTTSPPSGAPGDRPGSGRGEGGNGAADFGPALLSALEAGDDDALALLVSASVDAHAGIGSTEGSERYFLHRMLRALDLGHLMAELMRRARQAGNDASELDLRLRRAELADRLDRLRRQLAAEIRRRLAALDGNEAGWIPRRLEDLDVIGASTTDLRALRRAVRPLARKLASRVAAQRRRHRHGRLDLRRTARRSLQMGGVPLDPAFRRRRDTKPDVVVLCDVSGSVADFAHFTLSLVHALHSEMARLRSFAFVDGVTEVTSLFAGEDPVDPRFLVSRPGVVSGDGHSDYGAVFAAFAARHAADAVTSSTTVIVAGDARTNYRAAGTATFRAICARAKRVYWLNPEPREQWDREDSAMAVFTPTCTAVFEVRTLAQLSEAIAEIV